MTVKELKGLAARKIPFERQEFPDFKQLIAIIAKNKLPTAAKLQAYLEKELYETEGLLAEQKRAGPTIGRQRVNVMKKLDSLRQCQKLVRSYLT